jgi:hypothetical protein
MYASTNSHPATAAPVHPIPDKAQASRWDSPRQLAKPSLEFQRWKKCRDLLGVEVEDFIDALLEGVDVDVKDICAC